MKDPGLVKPMLLSCGRSGGGRIYTLFDSALRVVLTTLMTCYDLVTTFTIHNDSWAEYTVLLDYWTFASMGSGLARPRDVYYERVNFLSALIVMQVRDSRMVLYSTHFVAHRLQNIP